MPDGHLPFSFRFIRSLSISKPWIREGCPVPPPLRRDWPWCVGHSSFSPFSICAGLRCDDSKCTQNVRVDQSPVEKIPTSGIVFTFPWIHADVLQWAFHHTSGPCPTNGKTMKKSDSFPTHNGHSIPLSEELWRIGTALREAESLVEFEMAMRDLERIVKRLENRSGA